MKLGQGIVLAGGFLLLGKYVSHNQSSLEMASVTNLSCFVGAAGSMFIGLVGSLRGLQNKPEVRSHENRREPSTTAITRTNPSYITPQSIPERNSSSIARVLERDSRRRNYVEGLRQGGEIVRDYFERLSPEEYSKVRRVNVYPEQQMRVFGLPCGRKSLEVKIKR